MPERFEDMVLSLEVLSKLTTQSIGADSPLTPTGNVQQGALAQHAADMAYEIACPVCIGGPASWTQDGEARYCLTCSGTGRVTLGALVGADRVRKNVAGVGEATPHGAL